MLPTDPQRAVTVDRRTLVAIQATLRAAQVSQWFEDANDGNVDITISAVVRQAEMTLEMDPPVLPVAYEKIYDAWHNEVRGQNPAGYFGIDDVVRWDNGWIAS